jgi:tetratricopeptide (TPR) repeat protein
MFFRLIIMLSVLLNVALCVQGQQTFQSVDSLFNIHHKAALIRLDKNPNQDTGRLRALFNILYNRNAYFAKQKKQALPYAFEAILLSKKLSHIVSTIKGYQFVGMTYRDFKELKLALTYYDTALQISKNRTDTQSLDARSSVLVERGRVYLAQENYNAALSDYLEALSFYEKRKRSTLYIIYLSIGNILRLQGNYEKALEYYKIGSSDDFLFNESEKYMLSASILNTYLLQKQHTKAAVQMDKMLVKYANSEAANYWNFNFSRGQVFEGLNNLDSAYFFYKEALNLLEKNLKHSTYVNDVQDKLIPLCFKLNKIEEGKKLAFYQMELAKTNGQKEYIIKAQKTLSLYYTSIKDYNKAYNYLLESIQLNDEYLTEKNIKQNNTLSAIYETEKAQRETLKIQYELTKKDDSIRLQKSESDALITKQLFLNNEQKQNILLQNKELLLNKQTILNGNQQVAILNKDKELQHLAYLKTQADLQTEQLLKGEKETQLTLVQKEKLLETAKVKDLSQQNEFNILKRKQLLGYGLATLATLLFGGLYLFNRNKNKQAQLKLQLEKKEAEFQKSLTDVSLSALRSQMNPHFIFNCLNSIKLYTAQNDTVAASNYLTKFSKLIRMALENSRSETVNLQNEIESLELYIQMEAMRFKDKLKYSIDVDKNVDADFIEIPPMLLQPYVENAIWHGLMHKEDGGNITIKIANTVSNDALIITIEDDGVGREKAAQLRSKTATSHKSFGTKVTSERLELINKLYKTEASVTTTDVIKNNAVAGTLVTIKIPFA